MEKWLFFRAATAGLGKYSKGGYDQIGVYRLSRLEIIFYCLQLT